MVMDDVMNIMILRGKKRKKKKLLGVSHNN
jgi:hypothetical protein